MVWILKKIFFLTAGYFWQNREKYPWSLNRLFRSIGISKQSFHQRLHRMSGRRDREHQLLFLVYEVRKDHPTMNCRDMYYMINPPDMGRDAFERFCKDFGLSSQRAVDMRRTTDSSGVKRFENLASGKILTGIDQIWVSDITYYELNRKFYYLTFI